MDNMAHSGKVKISLHNQASIKECKDPNVSGHGECWMSLNGHIHPSDSVYQRIYL